MTFNVSFLDEMARQPSDDPQARGVMVGHVINVLDPLMLGRVQVQLPSVDALDLSPWARVAMPAAGIASGMYWIPNMNDEVLVAFENGSLDAPYVIGCLWSALAPPPMPSPLIGLRALRTPFGNQILTLDPPMPTMGMIINTADGKNAVIMLPTGMILLGSGGVVTMGPQGITLAGTNINLVAGTAVSITAPTVSITGATATTVTSGGKCTIASPMVTIN